MHLSLFLLLLPFTLSFPLFYPPSPPSSFLPLSTYPGSTSDCGVVGEGVFDCAGSGESGVFYYDEMSSSSFSAARRKLAEDDDDDQIDYDDDDDQIDDNNNDDYSSTTDAPTIHQIQYYQISLWTSVGLVAVAWWCCALMEGMPMEKDTLLYGKGF